MLFTAELEATGGTTTGFAVPEGVVEGLGAGRRPKIVVTVAGHTWRSSIASADDAARTSWESLSHSAQRGFAEPIGATKSPETAQRRLDKAMTALREGRKRP